MNFDQLTLHSTNKKRVSFLLGSSVLLMLASCVTINIYFPAAAAEKAAEKIVDEVWQIKGDANKATEPKPESEPKSAPAKPDGK